MESAPIWHNPQPGSPVMLSPPPTAVFDLDGTLLNGDSTKHWLRQLLLRSFRRATAAAAVLPVAYPLVLFRSSRRIGASTLFWVASFGMSSPQLRASAEAFAGGVRRSVGPLVWRNAGMATLERHLAQGHRVAVVTAAPEILATALLEPWRPRVIVLGSSLKQFAGGWIGDRYCRGREKCRYLAEHGIVNRWEFAYTDSLDDVPLLEAAASPAVVNATQSMLERLRSMGLGAAFRVTW